MKALRLSRDSSTEDCNTLIEGTIMDDGNMFTN